MGLNFSTGAELGKIVVVETGKNMLSLAALWDRHREGGETQGGADF